MDGRYLTLKSTYIQKLKKDESRPDMSTGSRDQTFGVR